jgi:5-hydroxyisourate hydrolase
MGALTTHVLDTARGQPAGGIRLSLYRLGGQRECLWRGQTNPDGRCDQPLLTGEAFTVGEYELEFQAGEYFRSVGVALSQPPFLDRVVIRFGIAEPGQHYHVPLLLAPYGYSTYRGS